MSIEKEIKNRILVLDGAMGTMLQAYKFTEEDFRGERFKDYPTPLQGNMICCPLHNQKRSKLFMVNTLRQVQIL